MEHSLFLQRVPALPDEPGVYLFYNKRREIVYVGKATSLKNRVRSYFAPQGSARPIEWLFHEVVDLKTEKTASVLEAIILESIYIKKFQPVYNVIGKDDKSWNYLVMSNEMYPTLRAIREHDLEGKYRSEAIGFTREPSDRLTGAMKKDFLYLFGPFPGLNAKATMQILRRLFYFSTCQQRRSGKKNSVHTRSLHRGWHGRGPCFYYQIKQCLGVCTGEITPKEYQQKVIRPLVLFLKGKKMSVIRTLEKEMKVAVRREDFEEAARVRDQLSHLERIEDVALMNASFFSDQSASGGSGGRMKKIEGYDISNLGSTGAVGSMAVFVFGEPDKSQYRRFRIKTVVGQSDVDCLEEVIRRRLRHADWPLPNLFLIDGGKPQVNRIQKVFKECSVHIPIVGIAKGPERKRNDILIANDSSFGSNDANNRIMIRWIQNNQNLLIRVRDEAHRFALVYQRKTRQL